MIMTKEEIVRDYNQAKAPQKQIGILADQNLCKKSEIVEILKEAGCKLPGNYYNKPPKTTENKPEDTDEIRRLTELNDSLAAELRHLRSDNEALRELVVRMAAKLMGVTAGG